MRHGFMGKILMVDLARGETWAEEIGDEVYEAFLSGSGLGAYILHNRIPPGADPLGPDNILGFVAGILAGSGALFSGRWMAVGKSPLTGTWGDANCGGNFAPAIKRCGYDGVFFSGISEKPVYLYADTRVAELRDARDLWGMDALETEKTLQKRIKSKKKPSVACVGPAGERLSLISGIVHDRGRIAARSGLGAVMGSKRLKALALCGARPVKAHDRKAVKALSKKCHESVRFDPPFLSGDMAAGMGALMRFFPFQMKADGALYKIMLKKWGTAGMNQMSIEMGDAPVKNWRGSSEDFGQDRSRLMNPDLIRENVSTKYFCHSCPLGCGGLLRGPGKDGESLHKPEYETITALGALCMNGDMDSVYRMNDRLNRAGMDTISAGGTIAFAMECFEKGILTPKDLGGMDLSWGNAPAMEALVEKMIRREGIGDLLADGSKRAAERIGNGAASFAIQAGGQELGMHDSRFDPGFALHNRVEAAPGRHTVGSQMYYEMFQLWEKIPGLPEPDLFYSKDRKFDAGRQKAVMGAACSRFMNVINGAGCCLFGALMGVARFPVFEWLNAATGRRLSPEEYMEAGGRIQTLKQAFNVKHGVEPASVQVNDRSLGRPPQKKGANQDRSVEIEKMTRDYWKEMGWDPETGVPGLEKIQTLEPGKEV
ncbi:Aldehyde ferredoxin oxidoreductase [Candidatus Desulfarcum epimagneticum]|uniref:Aldehyde ferredoxin oxidoreductase n=1 Tax=uncultured Desulfobacteraceae bacterium TaxID=218296 RepID=A0A484HKU7_9BACT|nr:Aldehyde ferredoxin oxidoreductase [uncultured Desulfobacteraceae bacterium]